MMVVAGFSRFDLGEALLEQAILGAVERKMDLSYYGSGEGILG